VIARSSTSQVENREGGTATNLRPTSEVGREEAAAPTPDPMRPSITRTGSAATSEPVTPHFEPDRGVGLVVVLLISAIVLPIVIRNGYKEFKSSIPPRY
jgi:hypothetical protein